MNTTHSEVYPFRDKSYRGLSLPALKGRGGIARFGDVEVQQALEAVYGTVDQIDVFVGGLAEDHAPGAMVGELFQTVIAEQFERLRDGDRFWYENAQFTATELELIQNTTLGSLVERNTEIANLPDNVFTTGVVPDAPSSNATTASATATEFASFDGTGNNPDDPQRGSQGDHLTVNFSLDYGDGISTPAGADRPGARTISNSLFDQREDLLNQVGATTFSMFWGQFLSHDFSLSATGISNTLKIHADRLEGDLAYPFVAEKLPLMLGHQVYEGVNNIIDRPIYLPALDTANGVTIDPTADTTVTTENIPGASVFVEAGSLEDSDGNPFTGQLSITEVPPNLTPAALPDNLFPDLVVTIQPGEMVFTTPAPITLPNRAGWAAGTEMDLWSINPVTGEFEIVGRSRVSDDGSVVETIEGGIRNSSWHFAAPPPGGDPPPPPDDDCDECKLPHSWTSSVEADSGIVTETHDLVGYQSNGEQQSFQLVYDSMRADPRPIVPIRLENVLGDPEGRLVASLSINRGQFEMELPGYTGDELGLSGNEHFWSLPEGINTVNAALQADFSNLPSGQYQYTLRSGLRRRTVLEDLPVRGGSGGNSPIANQPQEPTVIWTGSSNVYTDEILHVNSVNSAFGSGWGIAGWQELVENDNGSVLVINGNGSEVLFEANTDADATQPYTAPPGDESTLERLANGTFRRTSENSTVYQFNQNHQLESVTDRNGNQTLYVYDGDAKLIEIVDSVGLKTQFTYNTNGRVSQISDPAGRITQLEYDQAGNLIQITDPDGATRTWSYDRQHHMTGEIDALGNGEQAFYDFAGRATKAIRKDGSVVQLDPAQVQGLYRPDATVDPDSAPTAYRRNIDSASYADANGNVVRSQLDNSGQRVSAVDGEGRLPIVQRDENNRVTARIDSRGNRTEYSYDSRGNLISVSDSLSSQESSPDLQPTFGETTSYEVNSSPETLTGADLNGDGILDLISANTYDDKISILFGTGDGSFVSGGEYVIGESPLTIATGDVNGDQLVDLAIGHQGVNYEQAQVSFLLGSENGTFTDGGSYLLGEEVSSLVLEDVDNDNDLDLITTFIGDYYEDYIAIWLGDNRGNFNLAEEYIAEIESVNGLAVGDLNGDLVSDLVIASSYNESLAVYLGDGDGSFTSSEQLYLEREVEDLALVDLNEDGNLDLVTANGYYDSISILLGTDDGSFSSMSELAVGGGTQSLASGDLNGNGHLDLLVIGNYDDQVSLLTGNGSGNLALASQINLESESNSVVLGDLNGDSNLDIVTGSEFNTLIAVKLNTTEETNLELITFENEANYAVGSSPEALTAADLNNDGVLDLITGNTGDDNISILFGVGDGSYVSGGEYVIGGLPLNIATGDVNGDQLVDLAIGHVGFDLVQPQVTLLFGTADGTFINGGSYLLGEDDLVSSVVLEDVDNDNDLDLIATFDGYSYASDNSGDGSGSENSYVSIWLGDNTGSFNLAEEYIAEIEVDGLAVGDLNGDSVPDLVVASSYDESLAVYLGNGNGSFTSSEQLYLGRGVRDLALIDLNDDGNLDLVTANGYYNSVSILLGAGDGIFGSMSELLIGQEVPSLASGDLNGDGYWDLAINSYGYGYGGESNQISLLMGDGSGNLILESSLNLEYYSDSVILADLDGDSDLDIVTNGVYDDLVAVRLNTTGGSEVETERRYTYDPVFNQVTGETDELGRQTLYEIDPNTGDTLSVTRVVGSVGGDDDVVTRYTYTDAGQMDLTIDPLGRTTDYDYDIFGRLVKVTYAKGTESEAAVRYEYDLAGNQTAIVDENGVRTEFEYDLRNRLVKTIYAVGTDVQAVETIEYDAMGNQVATVDANGNRTEYVYDEMNRLVQTITADPDGDGPLSSSVSSSFYDKAGNLIATVDPLGRETRYVYDARNRLVETIQPDGSRTTTSYDSDNNSTGNTDAGGSQTKSFYDARNRLIRTIDSLGNVTSYEYDVANQMVAVVDGLGNRTEYEYDELGRQIVVRDAVGNVTRTEYDQAGNVIATIDPLGNRTEYEFDERDLQIAVTDANGGTITTEYDAAGNALSITDPVGNQTSYTYDARNRLVLETNPLDYTRSFSFDAVGNQTATTDRNGRTRSFSFDGLNRQIAENWLDIDGNVIRTTTTQYDAASQLIAISDPDSSYSFTYDQLGRMVTVDNTGTPNVPGVVLTYDYDDTGNIISVSDNINGVAGAATTYSYDELNRVTQITQSGSDVADKRVDFTYNAIGQYEFITRYSDLDGTSLVVDTSFTYDEVNRLTNLTHANPSEDVAFYDFSYDGASRITQIVDIDGTSDYSYDNRDQLIGADHSDVDNPDEFYSYDANGNRVSSSGHGDGYVTDINNRLVSDGVYNYNYDKSGNLIRQTEMATGKTTQLEWDYLNRLIAFVEIDSAGNPIQRVEFTYDMFGRRLSKMVDLDPDDGVDGKVTYFVYDRDNVILDFVDIDGVDGTAEVVLDQRYLHGTQVDQVLAQENGAGDVVWHLSDHLGSVRDLVDSSGTLVNHFVYDAFGNVVSSNGETVISRYLFTGREWDDEIGLYYYRARFYDATVGRFISQDPIGFEAGDSNLYRYVGNSPIIAIDPSGLITFILPGGFGEFGTLPFVLLAGARYPVIPIPNPPGGNARQDPFGNKRAANASIIMEAFLVLGGGLEPCEPINIIAHSDGNRVLNKVLPAIKLLNLGEEINVVRLDPAPFGKPSSALANTVDIGSNNLFSFDPRDVLNALWPTDIRAAKGVSHNGLLTDLGVSIAIKTLLNI